MHKKTIVELSIVRDPFHKSCKIGFVGNTIPLKFMNKCRIKTKNDSNDVIRLKFASLLETLQRK